ncbi:hypothetical protein Golax_024064 [Gossypium laxum]|uniref:Uncharacterized protein n=1 Tax=Gossypium laxum TaxID=34288 RepID=A0A7J8ZB58_9ROSI|nr:hypothetical protein [Gossypium laxum]
MKLLVESDSITVVSWVTKKELRP